MNSRHQVKDGDLVDISEHPHKQGWKLRLCVGLIMLILAFIGVIITDISKDGSWNYWRHLSIVYAILSLGLSFYRRKVGWKTAIFTTWHEIFHWIGLILSTFVVAYFVNSGIMGRFQAGIVVLTLLALGTYLAGVYIEMTFVPIGLLLGVFAAGTALFAAYIYTIILPLTIIAAVIVVWLIHRSNKVIHK
jgi:hypothetical protein